MSDPKEMTPERLAQLRADPLPYTDDDGQEIVVRGADDWRDLLDHVEALAARAEVADRALAKISKIRDSIVGHQRMHFSEHVYPLVAALEEAGVHGVGYDVARPAVLTLHERLNAAEERADAAEKKLAALVEAGRAMEAARVAYESAVDSLFGPGDGDDVARRAHAAADAFAAATWAYDAAALRAARGES